MLVGEAGAAIADVALQKSLQLGVAVGDAVEEMSSTSGCGVPAGAQQHAVFLGDVVERVRRSADAGAQIIGRVN